MARRLLPAVPGEGVVVARLDALEAVVVGADKAQQVAGEPPVRVIALGVGLKAHAADFVFGLEAADRVRLVGLDLAGDGDIPAAPPPGFFIDVPIIKPQDLGQLPRDEGAVLAVCFDLGGA